MGARQVGKTYLVKNLFAEKYFKNHYIYIDCRDEPDFVNYCISHVNDEEVLNYLSLRYKTIITKDTLLIFDEVQECLPVITLLKYFKQNHHEIPIIATGSMIRIRIQRENNVRGRSDNKQFLFPVGNINQITIYPLGFEEFLYNANHLLYEKVTDAYKKRLPLDDASHHLALKVFYDYLLIGGMPEAVSIFLATGSYQKARNTLIDLYDYYLSDMPLYQASSKSTVRVTKIFESIFSQLNKENKNFKPSLVSNKLKNRDLLSPLDWLSLAHLVYKSMLVKEKVTIPLMESSESLYRLYLSDVGLFSYQSKVAPTTFLSDSGLNSLSGIFFENYLADELVSHNYKLFYWKGKGDTEFEFIIQDGDNIIPIDVKKKRGTLNSLAKFKEHNKLSYAVKVSANKYGYNKDNKVLTIPFYDVFLYLDEVNMRNNSFEQEQNVFFNKKSV